MLSKLVNKKIGKAMHDYSMLSEGDRVLVAVSGGVDSMVLSWVLKNWSAKAPISYTLKMINVDNGFWTPESGVERPVTRIKEQLKNIGVNLEVIKGRSVTGERTCFYCAKQRRNQLFDIARDEGFNKIALGHHKDDLIETFFINILYSGNISTMLPKQELFDGALSIIRPLAYIEKDDVRKLAKKIGIEAVDNLCPLTDKTRRVKVRGILEDIYKKNPEAKSSIFASLGNVREGYML